MEIAGHLWQFLTKQNISPAKPSPAPTSAAMQLHQQRQREEVR